jgi:hypothetical protein
MASALPALMLDGLAPSLASPLQPPDSGGVSSLMTLEHAGWSPCATPVNKEPVK